MKKLVLAILLLFVFVGIIVVGLKRGDFDEAKNNGSVICLSCIGIE